MAINKTAEEISGQDSISNFSPGDGTIADLRELNRMGITPRLKRNLTFLPIIAFATVSIETWEDVLTSGAPSLINGGPAAYLWTYVATFFFMLPLTASLAEMVSMAPSAGGQYYWVSEFAPPSVQKPLSYIVGWVTIVAWQLVIPLTAYLAAGLIQLVAAIKNPSYVPQLWQGFLLIIAVLLVAFATPLLGKWLRILFLVQFGLHIATFIIIIASMWSYARASHSLNSSHNVWVAFDNLGGWDTDALASLVGLVAGLLCFLGIDSVTHLAEDVRDSSKVVPRAMMWTMAFNGSTGFVTMVTFCYCLRDYVSVLDSTVGFAFVQVFLNVTQSEQATVGLTCIVIVVVVASIQMATTTVSRLIWSFARDHRSSSWLSQITPVNGATVPIHALLVSFVVSVLLSLIYIGSAVAFADILAACYSALLLSYLIPIGAVLLKRIRRPEQLPPSRFSLGRYGVVINGLALLYVIVTFIFSFFPSTKRVTPATFNWNILVLGATVLWAIAFYVVRGRKVYQGKGIPGSQYE